MSSFAIESNTTELLMNSTEEIVLFVSGLIPGSPLSTAWGAEPGADPGPTSGAAPNFASPALTGGESCASVLYSVLQSAGYTVVPVNSAKETLKIAREFPSALIVLDASINALDRSSLLAEIKGNGTTSTMRILGICVGSGDERGRMLDLGADAALPASIEPHEFLANVRAQLRSRRENDELRSKARIAEQGQEIAHTAFNALAVTEKMARDATSLDRRLKIGAAAILGVALVMAGIFFLFTRSANKESKLASAALTQLERGLIRQRGFVVEARKLREELQRVEEAGPDPQKQSLRKQTQDLRSKIAEGSTSDVSQLRRQLEENNARLLRIERESNSAQDVIRRKSPSVCLLHVAVGFRDKTSGQMLHYAGINSQGLPLEGSDGKAIYTLGGNGPEVRADFFGTGFVAGANGRILTNHHVVEPWWKNDELDSVGQQNIEPVISRINAYFPEERHAIRVEIQKISTEADLAVVQATGALKYPKLELAAGPHDALSGEPLVSVGYATGLSAILARAGEDAMASIVKSSGGDVSELMAELARRDLIRPLTTQGHIGDVSADKIVFDAATTSGGSGGPLFNQDGKVIGVTFAIVRGFGGSNFGIPIRFAVPLLKP